MTVLQVNSKKLTMSLTARNQSQFIVIVHNLDQVLQNLDQVPSQTVLPARFRDDLSDDEDGVVCNLCQLSEPPGMAGDIFFLGGL